MAPRRGNWRGLLGVVVLFVVPVLIVLVAAAFWWGYLGLDNMLRMGPTEVREPIRQM